MRIISLIILISLSSPAMAEINKLIPMDPAMFKNIKQGDVVVVDPKNAMTVCDFHQQIVLTNWDTKLNQFPSFQDTRNVATAYMCVAK